MKDHFLTLLRNRDTEMGPFREAARRLSILIASDIASQIPLSSHPTEPPLGSMEGKALSHRVVLIPILRAGMVFLSSFLDFFPEAPVGFFG